MATESKCGCGTEEQVLRRLAQSFFAQNAEPLRDELDADAVAEVLGVTPYDAEVLCTTGLLKSEGAGITECRVTAREMLRFLETHGRWWMQLRSELELERVRTASRGGSTARDTVQ